MSPLPTSRLNRARDFGSLAGMSLPGRLNTFQRTMLLWDEMHAYNAVHVARMPGALEEERLLCSLAKVLDQRGIASLRLDAKTRAFEFRDGTAMTGLTVFEGGADPHETLRAEMERQINLRFDHSAEFTPFRFFAVPDGDSFWLGIVYFHAIADAEPIVRLACDFVAEYAGVAATRGRWNCHAKGRRAPMRLFMWLRKLLALPAQFRALRKAIRPGCSDANDFCNGLELFTLSSAELSALIAAGKKFGVTVNDFFLALLLHALAPLCEAVRRDGRDRISLGCIVNARRDLGITGDDSFGLVLGGFSVACGIAETGDLPQLARSIAAQTRRYKCGGLHLANALEMGLVLRLMSLFSTNQRRRFYPKNYPLWGGLTNMNLTTLPVGAAARPQDYLRAVSTGPVTPLVLSVTSFGNGVNVSMSYRTSVFSREEIATVRGRFTAAVRGLEAAV